MNYRIRFLLIAWTAALAVADEPRETLGPFADGHPLAAAANPWSWRCDIVDVGIVFIHFIVERFWFFVKGRHEYCPATFVSIEIQAKVDLSWSIHQSFQYPKLKLKVFSRYISSFQFNCYIARDANLKFYFQFSKVFHWISYVWSWTYFDSMILW